MAFEIESLPLDGLKSLKRKRLGDNRGFLSRLFCAEELRAIGWAKPVAQVNQTLTTQKGTVRGLHYQKPPYSEAKLISCIKGVVWDVAVDLRQGSDSFLNWHAEVISEENQKAIYIPEGFAHGFQALTDDVELLYFHSEFHVPHAEAALNVRDPRLSIPWPVEITNISDRDHKHSYVNNSFKGVSLAVPPL